MHIRRERPDLLGPVVFRLALHFLVILFLGLFYSLNHATRALQMILRWLFESSSHLWRVVTDVKLS